MRVDHTPTSSAPTATMEVATAEISTPEALTPIRRRGLARAALQQLTVRQLLCWLTDQDPGPSHIPSPAQREAESHAVLAIRELLQSGWCEVWAWQDNRCHPISLDAPVIQVAGREPEIRLDVRSLEDAVRPTKRRRSDLRASELGPLHVTVAEESAAVHESRPQVELMPLAQVEAVVRDPAVRATGGAVKDGAESLGYLRKTDWLRAQFLPEIEVLDFRGLFVGNKGLWILDDRKQHTSGAVNPKQIAYLLLRGNGYRRGGNHVKALMCYQELTELDPSNADFRYLLETTYQAIAAGGSGA